MPGRLQECVRWTAECNTCVGAHSDIYHVILNDSSHPEPTVGVIGSDKIAG